MPAKQQKFTIELSKEYSDSERELIADEIIEFIKTRTEKGKDKNNESFPKYSDKYRESLDFKNAGKSKKVNLKLSGDMLDSIELLNNFKNGKIQIGFEAGTDENARAEGNILGSYGGDPDKEKARDFLGIDEADLKKILKKYPVKDRRTGEKAIEGKAIKQKAKQIAKGVSTDLGE